MEKGIIVHTLIFNENQEALLIRRSLTDDVLPGVWDIPGGTLRNGEDPIEGVIRETKEETGIDIKNLKLFHYTSNVDQGKNKQFIRLIFIGACDDTNVILNPKDHDEYRWILIGESHPDMEKAEYLPDLFSILNNRPY